MTLSSLIFRKGFKEWSTTYKVDIGFEYTADLEKKLTEVTLHHLDTKRSLTVPWSIFSTYLAGGDNAIYADSAGLTIRPAEDGILVSDSRMLCIHIHGDQMDAIKRAASNLKEDISQSVERILKEFTAPKASV
jgi:hypothetical protein